MKNKNLLRGVTVLFLISITLAYLTIQLDTIIAPTPPTPEPGKEEKTKEEEKKPVFIPIEVVTEQPKQVEKKEPVKSPTPQPAQFSEESDNATGDQDPAVLATYKISIKHYLQFMIKNGAKIGLYDSSKAKFVCSIDTAGNFHKRFRKIGMSPRARRITNDFPFNQSVIKKAAKQYGPSSYEILLLIPQDMDDRFYRNMNKAITKAGRSPKDVSLVRVVYEGSVNSVRVTLKRLEGRGGSDAMSHSFYL